jgi:hypothetical protein
LNSKATVLLTERLGFSGLRAEVVERRGVAPG